MNGSRNLNYETIKEHLPKVELHAHLHGCIPSDLLHQLAVERGVTLPRQYFGDSSGSATASSLKTTTAMERTTSTASHCMYNVRPRSLQDCFDMFSALPLVVNDLVALRRITRACLHHYFALHHTAYVELRSTPKRLLLDFRTANSSAAKTSNASSSSSSSVNPDHLCTKQQYVETIIRVMREFEREEEIRYRNEMEQQQKDYCGDSDGEGWMLPVVRLPMVCRFIVSVDRSQSLLDATENIELAIRLKQQQQQHPLHQDDSDEKHSNNVYNNYVVGVDLGGNPTKNDFRDFEALFDQARAAGLKATIHTAEIPCSKPGDQQQYTEALSILRFRPDRIGHGVLLPADLMDQLQILKIPVEVCPTSNVMTLELHHQNSDSDRQELPGDLVAGLKQHVSLLRWINGNHPVAICTDDPGVFDTNPTQELWLLTLAFPNIFSSTLQQLASLSLQSMEYAFCDQESKRNVLDRMQRHVDRVISQQTSRGSTNL